MPILVARALFPYLLGYVATFCVFGVMGCLKARDPDYVVLAGVFLIGWASGPALFAFDNRLRMERFLRTLPVTHGDIITARFLGTLVLLVICWCVLIFVALNVSQTPYDRELCLKFVVAAIAWSLFVAGFAHFWTAHRGPSIVAGVILNVLLVGTTVPFLVHYARPRNTFDTLDTWFVSTVTAPTWWVQLALPLAGLWFFFAMMKAAAATSRPRDDD